MKSHILTILTIIGMIIVPYYIGELLSYWKIIVIKDSERCFIILGEWLIGILIILFSALGIAIYQYIKSKFE